MLTNNEKFFICSFFNEGGYVLDFSNQAFDQFTKVTIGVPLKKVFRLSKGQSLASFILERATDEQILILVLSLMKYAKNQCLQLSPRQQKLLPDLQKLVAKHDRYRTFSTGFRTQRRREFNEQYIITQFQMMLQMLNGSPSAVIRQADALLATCVHYISDELEIVYADDESNASLCHKIITTLSVDMQQVTGVKYNDAMREVLTAITTIVDNMDVIKAQKGMRTTGTKKAVATSIYAELMMTTTLTLTLFIWRIFCAHTTKAR